MGPEHHLDAVLADPDDLGAIGVYADALIEQGDPRGSFIAHQVALEHCGGLESHYPALLASADRLLEKHEATWLRGIPDLPLGTEKFHATPRNHGARWHRGLLCELQLNADESTADHIATIRRTEPLAGPHLLFWSRLDTPIAGAESWRSLRLSSVDTDRTEPHGFLASALGWGLGALRDLRIDEIPFGVPGATLIARHLAGGLNSLRLPEVQLGDAGLDALARGSFEALTALDLRSNGLVHTVDLLRSFPLLRTLLLGDNDGLGPHLDELADWSTLAGLQHLSLPRTVTPAVLTDLFPTPTDALRTLVLEANEALRSDPTVVFRIAPSLTCLKLNRCNLGDDGLAALLGHPAAAGLVQLELTSCGLTDASVPFLLERLPRLARLDLSHNALTEVTAAYLTNWAGLGGLGRLEVRGHGAIPRAALAALDEAFRR